MNLDYILTENNTLNVYWIFSYEYVCVQEQR